MLPFRTIFPYRKLGFYTDCLIFGINFLLFIYNYDGGTIENELTYNSNNLQHINTMPLGSKPAWGY